MSTDTPISCINAFEGAVVFIPLTQGQVTVIDFADREGIVEHRWCAQRRNGRFFYAVRTARDLITGKWGTLYLHRAIMKPGPGMEVDHRFGNRLDNRRDQLRVVTHVQNMKGFRSKKLNASSKFMGVSWNTDAGKWMAQIWRNGTRHYLGLFDNEIEAARAFDKSALDFSGSQLNLSL